MSTVEEVPDQAEIAPTPRLGTGIYELKKNAKGVVKAAVDALGIAASLTQNVPYLGAVSSALTVFLKIVDEVEAVRSDWESVITDARQIKNIVVQAQKECEKRVGDDNSLPRDFVEALSELEKCILQALKTLNACGVGSQSRGDRFHVFLKRADLASEVKKCGRDMNAALALFNTKLNIGTRFDVHELRSQLTTSSYVPVAISSSPKLPPPPPGIFYGRAREVDHIVDLVLHHTPARVAILGPGGIGKTSIALTALHHPDITSIYATRRFFISCETVTSTEGVVLELLAAFGLVYDPKRGTVPQQLLLTHLQSLSDGILCLDNLETLWDIETRGTEDLLTSLASFSQLALLVTTRGSRRPMRVAWTRPFLPPIIPLSFDAAVQAWEAICDVHDEYTVNLIEAVDCMPLAVTLLANLAESESSRTLWERWEHEHLQVLRTHNSEDRLSDIEYSIELGSLRGPRLRDEAAAIRVLEIICMLPQGLLETRVNVFASAFKELLPGLMGSISLLKQCSLVYMSEDRFLRVLSPVRHHMQTRYSLPDNLVYQLAQIYCDLVDHDIPGYGAMDLPYAQNMIRPEIGNISAILMHCLTYRPSNFQEKILRAIMTFSDLCQTFSIYNLVTLRLLYIFFSFSFPFP